MAKQNLKKEIGEIRKTLCSIKKKKPRGSLTTRKILLKEGYIGYKQKSKRLGDIEYYLKDKGKRMVKLFKCK